MKKYSIIVREIGSDHEVELCEVDRNPKDIADALSEKMLKTSLGRRRRIRKYDWIRIVDHCEASTVPHTGTEKSPPERGKAQQP
jgi:hypothetical protein